MPHVIPSERNILLVRISAFFLAMTWTVSVLAANERSCIHYTASDQCCETARDDSSIRAVEQQILALINAARRNAGGGPLSNSCELAGAARDHNARMMSAGFFDHRVIGEQGLLDRIMAAGIGAVYVGENLFMGSNPRELAEQCVTMWMQSDSHRENVLSPDFDATGISVLHSKDGDYYVTEDFARGTRPTPVVTAAIPPVPLNRSVRRKRRTMRQSRRRALRVAAKSHRRSRSRRVRSNRRVHRKKAILALRR